jgi:hypothetical protein
MTGQADSKREGMQDTCHIPRILHIRNEEMRDILEPQPNVTAHAIPATCTTHLPIFPSFPLVPQGLTGRLPSLCYVCMYVHRTACFESSESNDVTGDPVG